MYMRTVLFVSIMGVQTTFASIARALISRISKIYSCRRMRRGILYVASEIDITLPSAAYAKKAECICISTSRSIAL